MGTAEELRDMLNPRLAPPAPAPDLSRFKDLAPGVYPGLTYEEYDAIDAVRHSLLKEMARSPLRYLFRKSHPRKDTPTLRFGRLVHLACLEPHLLTDAYMLGLEGIRDFVLWEHGDRRGNAWLAFKAQHADRTILKPAELAELLVDRERAQEVARAVLEDDVAGPLFAVGKHEVTFVWIDKRTGLKCKCRTDHWHVGKDGEVNDLKTASLPMGIEERGFGSSAGAHDYHQQLAFYGDGVEACTGVRPPNHSITAVSVEPNAPHDVVVYDVGEEEISLGRAGYEPLMDRLAHCLKYNDWPGYANRERRRLRLPEYKYPQPEGDEWGMEGGA